VHPPRFRLSVFWVALAVLLITCLAVARLPEAMISVLARNAVLRGSERDWAFLFFSVAAVGQAAYAGFVLLRVDRIERELQKKAINPQLALGSIERNAAGIALITLLYGLAVIGLTGRRGSFWLFALIAVAQGAWYLRAVRAIAEWLGRQMTTTHRKEHTLPRVPDDYCPPLVRSLVAEASQRHESQ
jgi:hypothetical protein